METERYDVLVIGGGQAGLSVGYHLARSGRSFVILDARERIGDAWRDRWDSLRLFTPAQYDGLVGLPFPAPDNTFPTKDEMADYLESYAARFNLPVRTHMKVDRLWRERDRYVARVGERRFEAPHVVVAMASYQTPKIPACAGDLDPEIVQLHSREYRNVGQLRPGGVLIVGAGNSGAEIASEVVRSHRVWLSGRDVGHVPFRIGSRASRLLLPLLFRFVFHRVLTIDTPIGRKVRSSVITQGGPLIRVQPQDLATAGVERVPRLAGVRDGRPELEDGRVLDVVNVIWCTGFHGGFSWIDRPVVDEHQEPIHDGGVVTSEPGLYFVGLHFLYAFSSTMIHGIARDAERIARTIDRRLAAAAASSAAAVPLQAAYEARLK